jgi:hypothetical protein
MRDKPDNGGAPSRLTTTLIYGLLTAIALVPILSVRVPCLGDYLNHLARIHILTNVGQSADLQRFYLRQWQPVPYYGMDIPVASLSHVMNIYTAGRAFIALCVLMPVIAAATLRYALHGRVGLTPALAFLVTYNYVLALGFLNYLFSACLAVMLFALWVATAQWRRVWRMALFAPLAVILYLSHVLGFAAYAILVFGYELARAWRIRPWRIATIAVDFGVAASQALLPAALAFFLRADATFGTAKVTRYGTLADRIGALLSPIYFPGDGAGVVGAFVLVPLLVLWLVRPVRVASAAWPAALAVLLAACAVPHMLLNIWGTDMRLPLVAAIVLAGAVAPGRPLSRAAGAACLGCVLALLTVRVWDATVLLRGLDGQVAQMRDLMTQLPRGSRLLVVDGPEDAAGRLAPRAIIEHMSLVATIDRDAFVPLLFTGTTPLQVVPAMRNSASQAVGELTLAQLAEGFAHPAPAGALPAYRDGAQMFWLGWPAKFDNVLVTHFGSDPGKLPPNLRRVAGNDVATLYRIAAPDR